MTPKSPEDVAAYGRSMQRCVRRAVGFELVWRPAEAGFPARLVMQVEMEGRWGEIPLDEHDAKTLEAMCCAYLDRTQPETLTYGRRIN